MKIGKNDLNATIHKNCSKLSDFSLSISFCLLLLLVIQECFYRDSRWQIQFYEEQILVYDSLNF